MSRPGLVRLSVLAAAAALVLAGCSGQEAGSGASATAAGTSSSAPDSTSAVSAEGIADHVHNLALEGADLYLGTHEGLFRQSPGQAIEQVSEQPFDVMGLSRSNGLWLASGHPGEGMDAPSDLGLLTSADGVAWESRSLSGEVDFHRLTASGDTVLGLSAHDGVLLRSTDEGTTWTDLGTPPLFDLAVSPTDPQAVVGTTPDGPVASTDGGATFSPIADAPLIALLAWDGADLYGIDPTGAVLVSSDNGTTWSPRGSVPGQPMALAAQSGAVAALVDGVVQFSSDGGRTFAPRITGLAGH